MTFCLAHSINHQEKRLKGEIKECEWYKFLCDKIPDLYPNVKNPIQKHFLVVKSEKEVWITGTLPMTSPSSKASCFAIKWQSWPLVPFSLSTIRNVSSFLLSYLISKMATEEGSEMRVNIRVHFNVEYYWLKLLS